MENSVGNIPSVGYEEGEILPELLLPTLLDMNENGVNSITVAGSSMGTGASNVLWAGDSPPDGPCFGFFGLSNICKMESYVIGEGKIEIKTTKFCLCIETIAVKAQEVDEVSTKQVIDFFHPSTFSLADTCMH